MANPTANGSSETTAAGEGTTVTAGTARDCLVTLNAGSSSIKFALFAVAGGALSLLARGQVEGFGAHPRFEVKPSDGPEISRDLAEDEDAHDHKAALGTILAWLSDNHPNARVVAVGHRIVHGGLKYAEPAIVDDALMAEVEALSPLAPLHQPHNIAGIEAARAAFPGVPQVACFDTAFHRAHPFVNDVYALPRHFYDEGIRRYGFHGLSYEYLARRLAEIAPEVAQKRVVAAHLGNGASMCALRNGRSIASTMGFSALDGLAMGTRCGQLDPGILLYLMTERGMDAAALTELLYKQSGLKGLSELSHDMRVLEASETEAARDAIDYYVFRIHREVGAMAAVLNGLDAVVFAGGIGENAWRVRARALERMHWLGIELDPVANAANEERVTTRASRVPVFVIRTDEEAMIAEHTLRLVG